MLWLTRWPLHPFLLAAYPVLFLYSRNVDEAAPADVVRPMLIALAGTGVIFLVLLRVLRSSSRAAAVTTVAVIAFFGYGHVVDPVQGMEIGGIVVGRGLFLLPLWTLIALLVMLRAARAHRGLSRLTSGLNVAGLVLLLFSMGQLLWSGTGPGKDAPALWTQFAEQEAQRLASSGETGQRPDIYFIVLDEYARDDVLKEVFGYDNRDFLSFLESRGFYLARESHSNYTFTYPSLASTLNLDYLPRLAGRCRAEGITTPLLARMIEDNLLALLLKSMGYRFYLFPSDFYVTNRNRNADRLFRRTRHGLNNEFEQALISTTALRPLIGGPVNNRLNRLYQLQTLGEVARLPGPKLVFAHIIMPHVPYVFDREGNLPRHATLQRSAYTIEEYRELYVGQTHYLNSRMREVVDGILAASKRPPVIVIQGDHGFRHCIIHRGSKPEALSPEMQSAILNALYLPEGGQEDAYPSISPVNTFRLVLNRYFGFSLPLLPDETYVLETRRGRFHPVKVACWMRPPGNREPERPIRKP